MKAAFDKTTRERIAGRSGYRCAFLGCGRLTVGPGATAGEISKTGMACHIYSSSDTGPRGPGDLTGQERSSVENGIWLCGFHGRLVDENRGDKFPPVLLRSYRDEHEARIAAEHEGTPFHRLISLDIGRNPVFEDGSRAVFSKLTLVVGGNATGKSTLFRWIDQLSGSSRPYETEHKDETSPIEYTATIASQKERKVHVYRDSDYLHFLLDGEQVLFNPIGVEIINYDRQPWLPMLESFLGGKRREAGEEWAAVLDDVDLLAEYMGLNPLLIPKLLPFVGTHVPSTYSRLRIDRKGPVRRIVGDDANWKDGVSVHQASGSMLSRTVLEMEIAMANLTAQVSPTLLLLKDSVLHFDEENLRRYFDFFLSARSRFQVVLSSVDERLLVNNSEVGWTVLRLSGRAPNCRIAVLAGSDS